MRARLRETFWTIGSPMSPGTYRIKPIEDLDVHRLVRTTDVFAIGGHKCVL